LDGAGTCDLDSTTSEFNFLVTDELDDASTDVDDSAFEVAEEECLRGAPVPSPQATTRRQGKYVAWVVFRGHKQGVFQSWYVIPYEFVLSYETVQARCERTASWFQGKLCQGLLLTAGSTECLGACMRQPWCGSSSAEPPPKSLSFI